MYVCECICVCVFWVRMGHCSCHLPFLPPNGDVSTTIQLDCHSKLMASFIYYDLIIFIKHQDIFKIIIIPNLSVLYIASIFVQLLAILLLFTKQKFQNISCTHAATWWQIQATDSGCQSVRAARTIWNWGQLACTQFSHSPVENTLRETLLIGQAQYTWHPYTNQGRSANLDSANVICFFTKQANLLRRITVLNLWPA